MLILCTHVEPYCGEWFFGAKQLNVHYKMEHGLIVCAECGDQFAGERRTANHFAEMHAPQQEEDIWPDSSDSEPSTKVEPSIEEEEEPMETSITDDEEDTDKEQNSSGTEVGFSWRWPPD